MNEGVRVGRRGKTVTTADEEENGGRFLAGCHILSTSALPLTYTSEVWLTWDKAEKMIKQNLL